MDTNALKNLLLNPKRELWDIPQNVGRQAEMLAGQRYGKVGEWTGADAAKHMAWQAELARRSLLPAPLAAAVANVAGLGKEVFIDGLGSAGLAVTGGGSPTGTWKNSLMDLWNNYIGAKNGYSPEQAVEAAGRSTNSIRKAFMEQLPYSEHNNPNGGSY